MTCFHCGVFYLIIYCTKGRVCVVQDVWMLFPKGSRCGVLRTVCLTMYLLVSSRKDINWSFPGQPGTAALTFQGFCCLEPALMARLCGLWVHSVEACEQVWRERTENVEDGGQSIAVIFRSSMLKEFAPGSGGILRGEKNPKQNPTTSEDEKIHDFGRRRNDRHFIRVLSNPRHPSLNF